MDSSLAQDLYLLCWEERAGAVHRQCRATLGPSIAGALVLDAVRAGVIEVADDGRVRRTGSDPDDQLLELVVRAVGGAGGSPTRAGLVQRVADHGAEPRVRRHLVDRGMLQRARRRVLWVVPTTRTVLADPVSVGERRDAVRALLLGERDPDAATSHDRLLAALAEPSHLVDVLVASEDHDDACRRAGSVEEGAEIVAVIGQAVVQARVAAHAGDQTATLGAAVAGGGAGAVGFGNGGAGGAGDAGGC